MFQSSTASTLPIFKPQPTKQSNSSNYNWKTLTKVGLVFVTTTGAFLALKTTGSFSLISSWLKNIKTDFDEQETKLAVPEGAEEIEAYSGHLDFKESPLAVRKDSQHTAFMPQRAKRSPMGIPEKIGPEFQVNTYTTRDQYYPSITGLNDGKFVVTWDSRQQDGNFDGVYGQIFNADGTKFLSEFRVNTHTISDQCFSSIAGLSDGKFVVTWSSSRTYPPSQDGSGSGVYSQMFNADGSKYLSEFRVNTYTQADQQDPSVAGLTDGKFVVTWHSNHQDGSDCGIYGQMFNANGTKFLSEFQVNTYTLNDQWSSSITGLNDGKFVVTWYSWSQFGPSQDGSGSGVYGQMFNANGSKYLSEFQVNTYTPGDQRHPSVVGLSDGKFVVTWMSYDGDDDGIRSQMFNTDSTKFLSEFQVNTYTPNNQWFPSVAGLTDGKFVVTWRSRYQDGSDFGIYGQIFNANSTKFLSEFQVNTYTTNYQLDPSIAGLSDGKFVVTWMSDEQDGYGYGVYGQMFSANEAFASSHFSSSQKIPESSSVVSSHSPTASSFGTSGSTIPASSIKSSSHISDQSVSSAKKSSSSLSDIKSGSLSKSFGSSSDVTSQTSISSVVESSPTSIIESQSSSEQSSPSSTHKTSSLSNTKEESSSPILVTSSQSQRLSSSETQGAGSIGIIIGVIIGGVSVVLCIAGSGVGYLLYRRNRHKEYERELCDIVSDESEEPSPKKAMSAKKKDQESVQGESIKSDGGIFGVRDIQRIQQNDLNFEGDLGDGSFGRVYKATWQGSEVAVKVLKEGIADLPEFMGDFIREAATWSKLTHPNITRFFGICWTKPSPYIVVEYVGGGSLASHLKKKDLTLVQRLGLGLDTVRGLRYLHECDPPIWHRDIKPDNVLVEYTWNQTNEQWLLRGKVTDFGSARQKIINRAEKTLTKGVGTPIYQAPEIIKGSRDYSEKADVYSVGVYLCEIYTQKEPYSDQPDLSNQFKFFKAVTEKSVRPTIPEEMPKSYAALIKQCWAEKPSKRPNAEGVEQQLKPIVDEVAQGCTVSSP